MDELLDNIREETRSMLANGNNDSNNSILIAINISINRLLEELSYPNQSKQLIQTLVSFDERNMSKELLVACAETYITDFRQVGFCKSEIFVFVQVYIKHSRQQTFRFTV